MRPWSGMQASGARSVTAPFSARSPLRGPRGLRFRAPLRCRGARRRQRRISRKPRWAGAFLAPGIVVFGITWGEAPCEPPLKLRFRSACRYSRYRLHLASRHASRKAAVRPRSAEQGPLWGCDRRAGCSAPSYSSWSLARLHGHTFRGSTLRRAPIVDLFRGSSGGLPLQWRLLPAATGAGACDGGHLAATDRHS